MTPETKTEARERMDDRCESKFEGSRCAKFAGHQGEHHDPVMGKRWMFERQIEEPASAASLSAALSALRAEHQRVQAGAIEDAATVRRMEATLLLAQKLADPAHEETCTSPDCVACNTQDAIGGALAEPGPRSWGRGVLDRAEREIASLRSQLAEAQAALDVCRKANDEGRGALAASEEKARGMCDALTKAIAKCSRCHGRGTHIEPCPYCGDSTYDHDCPDNDVECEECKPLRSIAALSSSPAPGAAPKESA